MKYQVASKQHDRHHYSLSMWCFLQHCQCVCAAERWQAAVRPLVQLRLGEEKKRIVVNLKSQQRWPVKNSTHRRSQQHWFANDCHQTWRANSIDSSLSQLIDLHMREIGSKSKTVDDRAVSNYWFSSVQCRRYWRQASSTNECGSCALCHQSQKVRYLGIVTCHVMCPSIHGIACAL